VTAGVRQAIVDGKGGDTERTRLIDIARGTPWPSRYPGRSLGNTFLDTWRGREEDLQADEAAKLAYREAAARGDLSTAPVWASEAIDLIRGVASAADLVGTLAREAEEALIRALSPG
jgi:nitronate monooxygenase